MLDSARLYFVVEASASDRLLDAALEGGCDLLQLRDHAASDDELIAAGERFRDACDTHDALFVINDRVDVAMLLEAAVHVGQEDLPPEHTRKLVGADTAIGYSTHNEAQLKSAATEPIDYVALGPIFGTMSKQNPDPQVGLEVLRRLKPSALVPLVAIGGVTRSTAAEVWAAGADSIAVVGDLYPDVRRSAQEWLKLS